MNDILQETSIRIASKEDAKSINDISKNELGYSDCTESLVLQKLKKINFENEVVFVAKYKKKVIGFVHAQIYDVLYYESMVNILGLAVDSKFTKNGIGKSLMAKAEEWAKSKKIKLIRLNSGSTRTQAHNFYRNIGFSDEKTQLRFIKSLL